MPQDAWEPMPTGALHPHGVHPRNLRAAQHQPHVLERLQEALQATQKGGKRLWDITPRPPARIDTPSTPQRTYTGGAGTTQAHSSPNAARPTQHVAADLLGGDAPA